MITCVNHFILLSLFSMINFKSTNHKPHAKSQPFKYANQCFDLYPTVKRIQHTQQLCTLLPFATYLIIST